MGDNTDVIMPKAFVVPAYKLSVTTWPAGMIILSGAKLWVATAANTWQVVTSA